MTARPRVLGEGEEDSLEAMVKSKEHLSHWQAQESQRPGRENNHNWEGTLGKHRYWGEPGVSCTQEKKAKGTLTRKVKDRGFAAPCIPEGSAKGRRSGRREQKRQCQSQVGFNI